jgi:hypothetical protein
MRLIGASFAALGSTRLDVAEVSAMRLDVPVSVRDLLALLPSIDDLRHRSRSMAMLDAIVSPQWEMRYFSYDSQWAPGQEMASMRNGSGDEYWLVFGAAGASGIGFDHESVMSPYRVAPPTLWPGLIDSVPEEFRAVVREPAFSDPQGSLLATVCFWRGTDDTAWSCGDVDLPADGGADPDGADWLFGLLADGTPEAYLEFAHDYYEVALAIDDVRHVYAQRLLTNDLVRALNPTLRLEDLAEDREAIGYPTGS